MAKIETLDAVCESWLTLQAKHRALYRDMGTTKVVGYLSAGVSMKWGDG